MFNCLSLKMPVPFRTIQKIQTNCCFRAEAQGRRVNTIIKRHLPLKMLFHCKKLSASAPLREIILFTLSASRTTATESAIQDNPKNPCDLPFSRRGAVAQSEHIHQETSSSKMLFHCKKLYASAPLREITVPTPVDRTTPSTTYFSRRGAGAQSEHIHQETSSPKNALPSQKALRLSASARDHSAYDSLPHDPLARRFVRSGAQWLRVNAFIKGHLPLKSSFIAKSSAPQRLCARLQCPRQLTAQPPTRRIFRAEAQSLIPEGRFRSV